MKPGTLVIIFGEYKGVIIKAPEVYGRVSVMYQMPNGTKVRGSVSVNDVKER